MIKWEYKKITHDMSEDTINRLGEDGWELVGLTRSVTKQDYNSPSHYITYIFKRAK